MNHAERDDVRVVAAAVAPNEIVAELWQQVLEDEGIIVALKPGGMGHSYVTNALNEHYILVREDQAERARAIIAELETEDESSS